MTDHKIGTREEWLAARIELLKAEKELTHRSDDVARRRQELPWVQIDKEYRFETENGSASLADLFQGRSQLLIYHFMFGPDYTAACPSCSAIADGFNGFVVHLANHDVMLSAVSRAPLEKLQTYKQRMGWTCPWASSYGSDFNFDFSVGFTEEQQRKEGIEYNYEREPPLQVPGAAEPAVEIPWSTPDETLFANMTGTDVATYTRERPGMSAFILEDGVVYTPIPLMRVDSTDSGACTSGSTAHRRDATRRAASGGAAATSMASAEQSRSWSRSDARTYCTGR